jgi:hypothetical protein
MRPFVRPPWNPDWSRHVLVDVVFEQLGRYCAACERPLTVGAFLYEVTSGRLIGGQASAAGFGDVLPLCDSCAGAALGTEATVENALTAVGPPPAAEVLRPDLDLTFSLGEESPLRYERRTIDVDGVPTELVLVVGADTRGQATVQHYALNTPFATGPTAEQGLQFPPGTSLAWPDPRLELRTQAWDLASGLVPLLGSSDSTLRELMISQARIAIRYAGFWSVWATVLAEAFDDPGLLARLLLPSRRNAAAARLASQGATPAAGAGLTGHAGDFPGTRTEWLGGAR